MIEKKNSYLNAKKSLDQIMEQIRSKDVPLEQALDLYEEAIRIGNSCAEMIDKADFSMEEIEAFNASQEEGGDAPLGDGQDDDEDAAAGAGRDADVSEGAGDGSASESAEPPADGEPAGEGVADA